MPATLKPTTARLLAPAIAALTLGVAACGSSDSYRNEARPAVPIDITAAIARDRILVSPTRFGAGRITLTVTNQTDSSQDLTLETDEIGGKSPGVRQSTGPMNPGGGTGQVELDVRPGRYRVAVDDSAIRPVTIVVGPRRPSSNDTLRLP